MLPDDQVHPDTHVLTMVNNVIGVVNYVIAARSSLLNFMIADTTHIIGSNQNQPLSEDSRLLSRRALPLTEFARGTARG